MISAQRNAGFEFFFTRYLRWLVRRSFDAVWLRSDKPFPANGFVATPNHASWWDGFLPYLVQRAQAPNTPFYLMMTERELRRFSFFRMGGAFSIDAASPRSCGESIRYAARCAQTGGAVWIYPEGELRPPGGPPVFKPGFLHVAQTGDVPIVPVALRVAMLQGQRPEAFVAIGDPVDHAVGDALANTQAVVSSMLGEIDAAITGGTRPQGFELFLKGNPGIDRVIARSAG